MRSSNPQAEFDQIKDDLVGLIADLKAVYRLSKKRPLSPSRTESMTLLLAKAIGRAQGMLAPKWPEPTEDEPDLETLEEWMNEDGGCEATDGCWVEPDGVCSHGHPSWLLRLGLI